MARGKIKWYREEKGFGFLIPDEGGNDIFLHVSGLNGFVPKESQQVSYDVVIDKVKGKPCAVNVKAA